MRGITLSVAAVLSVAVGSSAFATTRSSFTTIQSITGVTAITSNAGFTYTVSLGANPSFMLNDISYTITDVIGFYLLSDDQNLVPLPALSNFGPPGFFVDDSTNNGIGGVAGWKSNPNDGLVPGESLAFTLPADFPIASIDTIGFHVRLDGLFPGTTGNTGNIAVVRSDDVVPTPGACALLACGGLCWPRRRR
jgi:hypothetical protein